MKKTEIDDGMALDCQGEALRVGDWVEWTDRNGGNLNGRILKVSARRITIITWDCGFIKKNFNATSVFKIDAPPNPY